MSETPRRPVIVYPVEWEYRVIGQDEDALRAVIDRVFAGRDHLVRPGKRSRAGRWVSVHVELVVDSEPDRDRLHALLVADAAVRMVM